MSQRSTGLCRGDLVEVKTPDEILQTLDAAGALDHLPFMPEMLEFCGQRFRVSRRALTVCTYEPGTPLGFNPSGSTLMTSLPSKASAVPAPLTMVVRNRVWFSGARHGSEKSNTPRSNQTLICRA